MRDFSNYVVEENVCCLSISVILRATEKRTVQYCANECLTHFGLLTCTERRMSSREVSLRTVLGVLQNRMYPIVAVLLQSGGTSSKRSKRRLIQLCLACSPRRMQNGGDPAWWKSHRQLFHPDLTTEAAISTPCKVVSNT